MREVKKIIILAFLFWVLPSFSQVKRFPVGSVWSYDHALIRDSAYWESPYAIPMDSIYPVEIQEIVFYEGIAKVEYNEQVGFIDTSKKVMIPFIYQDEVGVNRFEGGKAVTIKKNKWGVIDTEGNTYIPFIYDKIRRYDDLYYVMKGYKWGYLDAQGDEILPLRDYHVSHIMSKAEVYAMAQKYSVKDSLENSVNISKKKAVSIAKKAGYYHEEDAFGPKIELNSSEGVWEIGSIKRRGTTHKGDCAHTNGCLIHEKYYIKIDAYSGKVLEKTKKKVLIPVYE